MRKRRVSLEHRGFTGVPLGAFKLNNKNQPANVLAKDKGYNLLRNDIKLIKALGIVAAQGF